MSNFPQKITSVIKTFSSFIIVSLIAALVVSCVSPPKDDGTPSTPTTPTTTTTTPGISVFSHSSYTFIPENVNITQDDAPVPVGRVLPKHAEIRKLVAAEINRLITAEDPNADKVEVDDISEVPTGAGGAAGESGYEYAIKYSFTGADADDANSELKRYFRIDSDGIITVESPFAFPVSLEDIFKDVPFVEVEMEITIRHANADKPLTPTVRVNFRSTDDALPGINDALSFDVTKVSENDREEEQPLMEDITYTGELSGTLADTALNGTDALTFTDLWKTATATPAENPADGTILDNVFTRITANDLLGLLNATETGLIQSIRVTFTPPSGATISDYVYASAANASAPVSIEDLNGNNAVVGSLLNAISDADVNKHYTMINADGIQVLNASIGWSFTYTYQRDFKPNPITILGEVKLSRTTQFKEEQSVTKNIPIDGVKTALDSYGFTTKATEQRTIFFTLLPSPDDSPASCDSNNVYLDNQDSQVKAGTSFNYEDLDTEAERLNKCILAASFTGVDADYQALIAVINATTLPDARVNSNPAPGVTCDEGFNCYYASLTVNITDVDEAPTIEERSDLSIAEGKGADAKYPGLDPISGALTPDDVLADIAIDITIEDIDEEADGTALSVNATETKVTSVLPTHGAGMFSIDKTTGNNNHFTLRVNATELDFEKFVEEDDLNAAGKAVYMVTISTQDLPEDSDDKEGFDKVIVKTMQVPVEITDVRYAPVADGEGLGFTRNANIENRSGDTVVLLPGASMLANGRSVLGTVKAVNPETDSDAGLFYAAMSDQNPSAEVNNFAVVTGLGDGTTPQNLILRGLNLVNTDDFNLTVVAFSAPPRFNSRDPVAVQTALGTSIFPYNAFVPGTGTGVSIVIPIVVDADAYVSDTDANINISREDLLDPATSPTFTRRQLAGNITEGIAGDNVKVDVPANFPIESTPSPTPLVLYNPATPPEFRLVSVPSDTTAAFALVTEAEIGAFGDTSALGITPSDANLFNINSSTGVISLKEGSEVVFPAFYNLVVRLANASDTGDIPSISLVHDYAVVSVLVNDENSAPVVSDFTALANPSLSDSNETADSLRLNITIDENTPAGTVLATFTVEDDNDDMFAMQDFAFGANINLDGDDYFQDAVKLTFTPASSEGKQKKSTATLTLVKPLNFEDFSQTTTQDAGNAVTITNDKITLTETSTISDKGRYELNPLIGQVQPAPVSDSGVDVLSASLKFNLVVRDVDEKPVIDTENSVIIGSVMEDAEDAPVPVIVTGISITIANVNATNADALVYELSGNDKFAEVFNVTENAVSNANTRILNLIVADADKLENLGDGLVHTATLTITNNTGGTGPNDASDPITIQVMVIDVQQPITPISLSATILEIAETDVDEGVADRTHEITESLFTYKATDVSKDADDSVTVGRIRHSIVDISYAITDVSFGSSTPDVAEQITSSSAPVFSLKAPDANGNVSLVVEDTDYIEAALFGDITATLTVKGTSPDGEELSAISASPTFTVTVAQADPKHVEYTTANANDNAPVYGFEYTQSDYAAVDAEVAGDAVGENVTLATNVKGENGLNEPVGGRANQINVDGENYNTTLVSVPSNSDINGYFIERGTSEDIGVIGDNRHAVHDGTLVIRLDSNNDKNITITEILSEDPSGKLVDITTFDNYFNIEINNTYNLDAEGNTVEEHKVLLITQKQFDVINSTGGVDASIKYNALDTIALFKDATEETTRTYYIRASQGGDNASTYALAQFYVDVEAAGLNIPAVIEELYIHNVEVTDLSTALVNFDIDVEGFSGNASMNENDIIPNQFGTHSLRFNVANTDYVDNEEGETVITVSVLGDGLEPTSITNPTDSSAKMASNNQLIALREVGGNDAPLGLNTNNVVINQTSAITDNAHSIEFALARNVYGTATIMVTVQENDANNKEIEFQDYTFTLTVNEDTGVNTQPTITPMLTDGTITEPLSFDFQEDIALLAGAAGSPATKTVTIEPGPVTTNDDTKKGQTGEVSIVSVTHVDNAPAINRNDDPHFIYDRTNSVNTIEYQQHGWGLTDIAYLVTETEPRGFGAVTATYTTDLTSRITVTQMNDIATEVEGSIVEPTYNLDDFRSADGNFDANAHPDPAKPLTITYNDNDLKFADFEIGNNVLPAAITRGTQVVTPLALDAMLVITPVSNGEPQPGTGTQFSVAFTTDFAPITEAQYNNISVQAAMALYEVTFQGTGAENVVADIPITVEANEFRVLENNDNTDNVFKAGNLMGEIVPINEGNSDNAVIATIHAEDRDLARPLTGTVESLEFTIGTIIQGTGVGNLEGKVSWVQSAISGSSISSAISNSIVVEALDDVDVGTYTIPWRISQSVTAVDGAGSIGGSFTLDVQNVPETFTLGDAVVTINYPNDRMGTLPARDSAIDNITIATISGITITSGDLNLPAAVGLGVLVNITPVNLEGDSDVTDKQLIELINVDDTVSIADFEDTKPSIIYFISTADIAVIDDERVLPEFKLVADAEFAGDEFDVLVNATLASDIDTPVTTGVIGTIGTVEQEINTNYDIQSPPSDLTIEARTGGFSGPSSDLVITEGTSGGIDITFNDKNIEGNAIDTWAGGDIDTFDLTMKVLNEVDEVLETITISDGFTYSEGTADVTIPFAATNALVGDRKYVISITDNRTEDSSPVALRGALNITGADSDFTIETRLNTVDGTSEELTYGSSNIGVAISVTSEDFTEGGTDPNVVRISFPDFVFNVAKVGDSSDTATCSIGELAFTNANAVLVTTGDTRNFVREIPLTDLDGLDPKCARLDYNIVGTSFSGDVGIELNNGRPPYTSAVTVQEPVGDYTYTRTGMRNVLPIVTPAPAAKMAHGGSVLLNFAVADGDPDDGQGRYTTVATNSCGGGATATVKTIDANTYEVNATDGNAAIGDTCTVTLVVTEDAGESLPVTTEVTVTRVEVPTISDATGGETGTFVGRSIGASGVLGSFEIARQATSALITELGLELTVSTEDNNCEGIAITPGESQPGKGEAGTYSYNYMIEDAATPGVNCNFVISAYEWAFGGGLFHAESKEINIVVRRQEAPIVVLSIPANLDDLANYNDGFTATATITDGDDDDGFADVRSNLTSTSPNVCTVDETIHQLGSALPETINRAVTIVGMPGESCELLLTSTANGEETTRSGSVVLPELAPTFTVNNYPTDDVTFGTNVPVIVTISDTDNDGVDGAVASIIPASPSGPSANCDYGAVGGVTSGAVRTFMVSSSTTNTICDISVSVTEDGKASDSVNGSITFTLPADAAPSITRKEPNATMANINEIVSLTVNISNTDMDPLAGAFISAGSAGSSGCTVVPAADIVIYSDSETGTQLFNITSATAGECIITVNTTEGAFTSANEQVGPITFIRPEVAPTFTSVLPYLSGRKIGNAAAFELDIRIDDGDRMDGFANASVTASSNPRDCTIAQVGNIEFVADGSRATQTFNVEGVSAGNCLLEFTAAENGTESYDTRTVEFIERVGPKVLDIFLTDSNADTMSTKTTKSTDEMFYINITIENVDDVDDLVSNTINPNPTGCTVTSASELKVRGKDDTGADLTQAFIVAATLPGTCTIRARASNNKTGDIDSEEFTFAETLTFTKVPLIVENVEIKPVNAIVGQPAIVNVSISDTDDLSAVTVKVTIVSTSSSANCRVERNTPSHTKNAEEGYFIFRISSLGGASICELNITAIEDSMESDVYTPRPIITFTEPGDAGPIALAWSDQVNESPFNGYMSIGNAGNSTTTLIPHIPGLKRSTRFVPATIGSRLAVVQTRFRPIDFNPVNYGETKFALSDGELGDTANLVRQFLVQVERDEYVTQGSNVVSRDTLLFYADTSSNHFDNGVLSTGAQTVLETAGIGRYLRFTTIAPVTETRTLKSSGNVRGVTTIPFAATYDNEKRLVRTENNRENFILPGGDSANPVSVNVSRYAGVTDLININVSNVPAAGAKISASICRLEGFDGTDGSSTDCASKSFANATEIKNILLLGGYWDREPYTSCEARSAQPATTDFYGWYKNKKGERDDYYCTATTVRDAPVVPKTLISGATHENTLAAGSGNTEFPMHIRHFMNTLPVDTQVGDDYSLNERNGYYLITIQAQDSSGTKIPGSNELKMLFHIGWEFPPAE